MAGKKRRDMNLNCRKRTNKLGEIFNYVLPLEEEHVANVIELSDLLDLSPGKLIIKALEKGLFELREENKRNFKCALYQVLEETEEKLRYPL